MELDTLNLNIRMAPEIIVHQAWGWLVPQLHYEELFRVPGPFEEPF